MIIIKTKEEITKIAEGGKILSWILKQLVKEIKPGITTAELEEMALKLIEEKGAEPSFKGYKSAKQERPFTTALCTSINEEIVHAPAMPSRELRLGDLLSIDVGIKYKGLYTDMATTIAIGKVSKETKKLLKVTKKALALGINQVKPGNRISDIAGAIQKFVERQGFSVVRDLVGHGVGKEVHEEPRIPNFVTDESKQIELKEGMVIAIEPMVCSGSYQIETLNDGWTAVAADKKLSAHFEHTVAVAKDGYKILTK